MAKTIERGITSMDHARFMTKVCDRFDEASGEEKLLLAYALLGIRARFNLEEDGIGRAADEFVCDWPFINE